MPREPFLLVTTLFRLVFAVLFLRLVWRVRAPIAAKIRGDGQSTFRRLLADLWPALMTAYVLCLLVVLTVEQLAGRLRTGRAGILSLLVVHRHAARRHGALPAAGPAGREGPAGRTGRRPAPPSGRCCDGASTSWSPPRAPW